MTVVSLMQFALATMIAGIYFFGWKMGTNPFILLRDSGVLDNAPALHINGDVLTAQLVMGLPMMALYFLSVGLSALVARRNARAEVEASKEEGSENV